MKRTLLAALCVLAVAAALVAEPLGQQNLFRYRLDNGLELYVCTDPSLPLVRIQIAYHAGAMAQRADNAGIFRLYERTLFVGDIAEPGSPQLRKALADLGLRGLKGGTAAESVSYWATLPSSKLEAGLALFSLFSISPTLDQAAFDAAKPACLSAISAESDDPGTVYESVMIRRLFAKYPWRRDAAGSAKTVAAVDLDSLKALQRAWFVPGNAALFVGGNVDPEAVRAAVERSFGSWKAADDPWKKPLPPHPRPGVMRPTWIAVPDPALPEGTASIEARYRGPDLGSDPAPSYAADLWSSLVSPAEGRFKTTLLKNVPGLLGPDTISAYYVSQREGSWISIGAYFTVDPSRSSADLVRSFKERARGYEITSMKIDPGYFSPADYDAARARLLAKRDEATETIEGRLDALSFWWETASVDYFFGYPEALAKTGSREVIAFLDTYIMHNLEIVAVRMNPADFERERKALDGAGFDLIGSDNAFWWQR